MPVHALVFLVALAVFLLEFADWDLLLIVEVKILTLFSLATDFLEPVDADCPLVLVSVRLRGERVHDRLHLIQIHILAAHKMLVYLLAAHATHAAESIARVCSRTSRHWGLKLLPVVVVVVGIPKISLLH